MSSTVLSWRSTAASRGPAVRRVSVVKWSSHLVRYRPRCRRTRCASHLGQSPPPVARFRGTQTRAPRSGSVRRPYLRHMPPSFVRPICGHLGGLDGNNSTAIICTDIPEVRASGWHPGPDPNVNKSSADQLPVLRFRGRPSPTTSNRMTSYVAPVTAGARSTAGRARSSVAVRRAPTSADGGVVGPEPWV